MPLDNCNLKNTVAGNISRNAINVGFPCASLLRKGLMHPVEDSAALLKRIHISLSVTIILNLKNVRWHYSFWSTEELYFQANRVHYDLPHRSKGNVSNPVSLPTGTHSLSLWEGPFSKEVMTPRKRRTYQVEGPHPAPTTSPSQPPPHDQEEE